MSDFCPYLDDICILIGFIIHVYIERIYLVFQFDGSDFCIFFFARFYLYDFHLQSHVAVGMFYG